MKRYTSLLLVVGALLVFCAGWMAGQDTGRRVRNTPQHTLPKTITVIYQNERGDPVVRTLTEIQTKQPDDPSAEAPYSDPRKTVVITFGEYGESHWRSIVAVEK